MVDARFGGVMFLFRNYMAGNFVKRIRLTGVVLLLALVWGVQGQVRLRTSSAYNQITVEDAGGYRLLRFNGSMEPRMWSVSYTHLTLPTKA